MKEVTRCERDALRAEGGGADPARKDQDLRRGRQAEGVGRGVGGRHQRHPQQRAQAARVARAGRGRHLRGAEEGAGGDREALRGVEGENWPRGGEGRRVRSEEGRCP